MIVQELMEGKSINTQLYVEHWRPTLVQVTKCALDVAKAMHYLHSNFTKEEHSSEGGDGSHATPIIHRDLKSANLLLQAPPPPEVRDVARVALRRRARRLPVGASGSTDKNARSLNWQHGASFAPVAGHAGPGGGGAAADSQGDGLRALARQERARRHAGEPVCRRRRLVVQLLAHTHPGHTPIGRVTRAPAVCERWLIDRCLSGLSGLRAQLTKTLARSTDKTAVARHRGDDRLRHRAVDGTGGAGLLLLLLLCVWLSGAGGGVCLRRLVGRA
jgi:hypothetical protein